MNNFDTDDLALFIPILAIGGSFLIALVSIVACTLRSISRRKHFENSRREIAAYVAEGSMTPEDGRTLLETGPTKV